jgi:hypothetical protein
VGVAEPAAVGYWLRFYKRIGTLGKHTANRGFPRRTLADEMGGPRPELVRQKWKAMQKSSREPRIKQAETDMGKTGIDERARKFAGKSKPQWEALSSAERATATTAANQHFGEEGNDERARICSHKSVPEWAGLSPADRATATTAVNQHFGELGIDERARKFAGKSVPEWAALSSADRATATTAANKHFGKEGNDECARIFSYKSVPEWSALSSAERATATTAANKHFGKEGGKEAWSAATLEKAGRKLTASAATRTNAIMLIFDSAVTAAVETIVEICPDIFPGVNTISDKRHRAYAVLCSDRQASDAFARLGADRPYIHEDHIAVQGGRHKEQGARNHTDKYVRKSFLPGLTQFCHKDNSRNSTVAEVRLDFDSVTANAELTPRKRAAYMYWRFREVWQRHVSSDQYVVPRRAICHKKEAWKRNVLPSTLRFAALPSTSSTAATQDELVYEEGQASVLTAPSPSLGSLGTVVHAQVLSSIFVLSANTHTLTLETANSLTYKYVSGALCSRLGGYR